MYIFLGYVETQIHILMFLTERCISLEERKIQVLSWFKSMFCFCLFS